MKIWMSKTMYYSYRLLLDIEQLSGFVVGLTVNNINILSILHQRDTNHTMKVGK